VTVNARNVLNDCRVARTLLEEETDLQRWRIHWAAAVALIRAVGHVLDKVDGANSSLRIAARARYVQWQSPNEEHKIFREFIEKERNNLLKEYLINVHPLEDVAILVEGTALPVDGGEPIRLSQVFKLNENIYRPLLDGPWAGDDARDVLSEAISWWEDELDVIDREVLAAMHTGSTEEPT
jgi:hypothetical protein